MINLRKEIQLSVQAAYYKAFGIIKKMEIIYKEPHYFVQLPTLSEYHKLWKQSLNPLDIANEVIVHIERPLWQEQKVLQGIEITQFGELRFLIDNQFYENCYLHLQYQKQINVKSDEICNILQLTTDERSNKITNQLKIVLEHQYQQVNLFHKDEAQFYNYIITLPDLKYINNPKIWMINQNYEMNEEILSGDPLSPYYINNPQRTKIYHHQKGLLALIPDEVFQSFMGIEIKHIELQRNIQLLFQLSFMKKVIDAYRTQLNQKWHQIIKGNLHRIKLYNKRSFIGWITIQQNSYNNIVNSQLNDVFIGKFNLVRLDEAYQIDGNFQSFTAENQQQIDQTVPGMLVYDSVNNKLLLFFNQQNIRLDGVVVGQVYEKEDQQIIKYLKERQDLDEINSKITNLKDITYNRIILAISAFSFLYILNSLAFDPAFEINRVIYRESEYNEIFNK